jgi:hypothetical protein
VPEDTAAGVTHYLWRPRQFGIIKKAFMAIAITLTAWASTIAAACRITEQDIRPALAHATP